MTHQLTYFAEEWETITLKPLTKRQRQVLSMIKGGAKVWDVADADRDELWVTGYILATFRDGDTSGVPLTTPVQERTLLELYRHRQCCAMAARSTIAQAFGWPEDDD